MFFAFSCSLCALEALASSSDAALESLKEVFKNPIFYIVIGSCFALGLLFYFVRRNVRAKENCVIVIVRGGKVYKLVDRNNPCYYLVPFRDRVGAVLILDRRELSSDELYVNDGPDVLYQISYSLSYRINDPGVFYGCMNSLDKKMVVCINEAVQEFASIGNASIIVKNYRQNTERILTLLNDAVKDLGVLVESFKIVYILPLGKR